ncbi:MAG: hypothetical protein JSW47_18420 [Phycisphaerales bacterium]|nr:MAG: hypothetical protein JSW47_18420 [Phycisphaerales bacterium]
MTSRAMIDEFFAQERLALVRASRKAKIHGCSIDKELGAKGYIVRGHRPRCLVDIGIPPR